MPPRYPGSGRKVYPGFLHAGFMAMNPDRHMKSHTTSTWTCCAATTATPRRTAAYDEYNAVLDMPAEFYLDTIRMVFQEVQLPNGTWEVDGKLVRPADIKQVALFTIEGELDDRARARRARRSSCARTSRPTSSTTPRRTAATTGFSGRRWRR